MNDLSIELLREELNYLMESDKPNQKKIIKVSQKLDKLIENYLEKRNK